MSSLQKLFTRVLETSSHKIRHFQARTRSSPDGRQILFHSNNSQNPDVSANLYTVRPNGTDLRQLTFETGGTVNYLGSSYSPDGTMITFGRRPETAGAADVFVAQADATRIRPVTRTALYDSYPDWGPAR